MSENKIEMTSIETGLSTQEVLEKTKNGEINVVTNTPTKTTKDIIKTNSLTLFNGLNLVLAALVIIAGQPANAIFVFVIISNTFIGIFQELRAKHTLAKLAVLNTFYVEVLRDGTFLKLDATEIVVGDILKIETGNQIAVDGIVRVNEAEVDESLLTGESDAVLKKNGDSVLAGSFLIAGSILVEATKVGDNMYASQLATEAKSFSIVDSQLMIAIRRIIKWVTTIIIPVGLLLIGSQLLVAGITWQMAIVGAVAGI
ncbi:MAG: HAD-IC family P-type ATPase, partial [Carnobacterium maltaromaticum]